MNLSFSQSIPFASFMLLTAAAALNLEVSSLQAEVTPATEAAGEEGDSNAGATSDHEEIKLEIGDSRVVRLPPGSELTLSRKGIVHLSRVREDHWLVIGLKPGFVLIQADYFGQNEVERSELIGVFVTSRNAGRLAPLHGRPGLQTTGQGTPGPEGRGGSRQEDIDRETSSTPASPLAQQGLLALLKDKLSPAYFRAEMANGRVLVSAACDGEAVPLQAGHFQALADALPRRERPQWHCRSQDGGNFSMDLLLLQRHDGDHTSFDGQQLLKSIEKSISLRQPGYDLKNAHQQEIVASYPSIVFHLGRKASFSSGGELETVQPMEEGDRYGDRPAHVGWKRFGLEFSFEVNSLFDDSYLVDYRSSINSPSSAAGRLSLRGSSAASQIMLTPGSYQLAGRFEVTSQAENESQKGLLQGMPIVGPLFQARSRDAARSTLLLFMKIAKIPDNATEKAAQESSSPEKGPGQFSPPAGPPIADLSRERIPEDEKP